MRKWITKRLFLNNKNSNVFQFCKMMVSTVEDCKKVAFTTMERKERERELDRERERDRAARERDKGREMGKRGIAMETETAIVTESVSPTGLNESPRGRGSSE